MAKKSKKKQSVVSAALQSAVTPLLELKYGAPLFAIAAHPSKPIIASGLANGYVFLTKYDQSKLAIYSYDTKKRIDALKVDSTKAKKQKFWKVENIDKEELPDQQYISHIWKTKRHKGSVRSICFNAEGTEIYTVGSDNIIKKADSETGKVIKKVQIEGDSVKVTKILKSITHPILVVGDEAGNVRVFNSDTLKQTNVIENVHEDAVNSIVQLQHKSAYQFLSVGSTTLAIWDVRKEEPTIKSENQEDEMLSCTFVDPSKGDTLICGMGEGLVTIWKQAKNNFEDQLSRVKVCKDESIDAVISTLNNDECVWAGSSNGTISKIHTKKGAVIETRIHSNTDEVGFLDIDYEYRLISAGMDKLKLWNLEDEDEDEDQSDIDGSEEFSDSSDESADEDGANDLDDWEDIGSESDENKVDHVGAEEASEEEVEEQEREELKPSKKNVIEKEENPKKTKKQKLNAKQLKNSVTHEHGIRKFEGL